MLIIPMHGIGGRQDLPLPFGLVLLGAAVALAASFLVLTLTWRTARYTNPNAGIPVPLVTTVAASPMARWGLRGIGLAAGGWALMALLVGPDQLTNPIFGFLYVWVWVGLVPVSLLFGPIWRTLNPLRSLHLIGCRVLHRSPERGLYQLPERSGLWPACVGLFGFVYLELVAPDRVTIPVVLLFVSLYVVAMLLGSVLFGQRWFATADPFEVYAVLIARLSPWGRRRDGAVVIRNPLISLASLRPGPGTVLFVVVLLGSTAYDGFSNSTVWVAWIQRTSLSSTLVGTAMLTAMIAIVLISYTAAVWLTGRLSSNPAAGRPPAFIHSMLPIAVGYVTAHYLTLLVFEGQRTVINWSDPLGRGWDVFGTADLQVSFAFANHPTAIAVLQAGAVVTGHIIGVVAAHDRALQLCPPGKAVIGQLPMLIVMIGYTVSGLLLLFSR